MNQEIILHSAKLNDKNIKHGFCTKNIPCCTNIYINRERIKSNDEQAAEIINNRKMALNLINSLAQNFCILRQIHSNKVLFADLPYELDQELEGDALVTTTPGLVLCVITADCVPVLFADSENKVIAAAHAGWRGARSSIIENTINTMLKAGAKIDLIKVAIGPSIHQQSYEVGPEFYSDFINESKDNIRFFINSIKLNHYMFDLPSYVMHKLVQAGITSIDNLDRNTFAEQHNFMSYRRVTLAKQPYKGNNLSFITIAP
jgi:YfiH family protein